MDSRLFRRKIVPASGRIQTPQWTYKRDRDRMAVSPCSRSISAESPLMGQETVRYAEFVRYAEAVRRCEDMPIKWSGPNNTARP